MSDDRRRIAVVIGEVDSDTRDEALRAALGLTLRAASVHVCVAPPRTPLGPEAERARTLLTMMGHQVDVPGTVAAALRGADAVEVWGPVGPAPGQSETGRTLTHLVRPGRQPAGPTPGEPVLHLPPVLDRDHADRLLDQLLAGGPIAVW